MGTKVHGKSYHPGYYFMRNLNEGVNSGSWSLYPEDTPLKNGLYYNNCLPRPTTDGYLEYDKEVLKQTILKHDAIFRNQVFELHRLYRIQMELMDEFKRKKLGKYPMPVEASQSSLLSFQMQSKDAPKMWHIPSLPSVNSACSRASVSGTDNMHSGSEFIKVNGVRASLVPIQNGSSLKDCELMEPKARKLPRRMFDLELPADEYIDCDEEGETIEKEKISEPSVVERYPLKRSCGISTENNVNMSLGNGVKPSFGRDTLNSDFGIQNKHGLADLNEPIQVEETADSVPINFVGPVACHREIKGKGLPAKPNSSFLGLPKEFFQSNQKSEKSGPHANILQLGKEGSRREWLSCNLDAGQSRTYLNSFPQGFCPENLCTPSEPIQLERTKGDAPPEYVLDNHIKRETWNENAICGIDISKRSQNIPGHYAGPVRHHPVMPLSDVTDSGSPSVSSWRTPLSSFNRKAIAVQAVPCFDFSAQKSKTRFQSPGHIAEKRHLNCYSKSNSSFETEASYRNGFSPWSQSESSVSQVHVPSVGYTSLNSNGDNSPADRFGNECSTRYFKSSDCRDVKSVKDMNLNLSLLSLSQGGMVCQRDVVSIDAEGENEEPSRGLNWLRATCNNGPAKEKGHLNKTGFSFLQNYSQQFAEKIETKEVPTPSSVQDFPSVSCSCDAEPERIEVGEGPSIKKILGFPIFDKPLSNDSSSHSSFKSSLCYPSEPEGIQNSGEVQVLNIDLSQDPAIADSGQQQATKNQVVERGLDKEISVVRTHINLNLCVDEEEAPSTYSSPGDGVKIAGEMDLEAALVPETAKCIPSGLESMEHQLVTPIHSSQTQMHNITEELVRVAAEAIVSISSSLVYKHSEDSTCHKSVGSLWDSLHWFAGVVCSNTNDTDSKVEEVVSRGKGDGYHEEASSDEIDYFEYMTLKLTETKVDEYWCSKPNWASDYENEEDKSTSLLVTRRRRGQARRGRQRRDFQRDILPGLASLSRHEVTEDLQMIGGLMRATGCAWQTGLARRNAAKNGWARGRRRSQGIVPPITPIEISPPRQQPNNSEVGLEDSSLKGWGKTTRRPRRQRGAAGNPPTPITQSIR